MNRDIEFRGKDVQDYWKYGYYFQDGLDNHYIVYLKKQSDKNYYYGKTYSNIEVIPETIGQYTGLKDKNGKKIFEGDILRTSAWVYGEEKVCICIYNQENNANSIIGFGLYTNDAYFKKYQELVECDEWDEFEVIGNIYENKELLED